MTHPTQRVPQRTLSLAQDRVVKEVGADVDCANTPFPSLSLTTVAVQRVINS